MDTANRPRVCRDFNVTLPITDLLHGTIGDLDQQGCQVVLGYQTVPFPAYQPIAPTGGA